MELWTTSTPLCPEDKRAFLHLNQKKESKYEELHLEATNCKTFLKLLYLTPLETDTDAKDVMIFIGIVTELLLYGVFVLLLSIVVCVCWNLLGTLYFEVIKLFNCVSIFWNGIISSLKRFLKVTYGASCLWLIWGLEVLFHGPQVSVFFSRERKYVPVAQQVVLVSPTLTPSPPCKRTPSTAFPSTLSVVLSSTCGQVVASFFLSLTVS